MPETQPTVVLVHGAFADASSFAAVIPELLADGLTVVAPAVPMRSLTGDAAYIGSVIRQIDGPVILVGHSYGGAVITVAGAEENVKALVYLSACALEEGESLGERQGRFPDSPLAAALVYQTFPVEGSDQPGTDVYVDVAKFPDIFAADVDLELARVLAVGQRPLAGVAFTEKAAAAAWKTKPAWGSVAVNDHTIKPDVERFGYQRAGMTAIEIESSHLVMLSHPKEVADLIRTAITGVLEVGLAAIVRGLAVLTCADTVICESGCLDAVMCSRHTAAGRSPSYGVADAIEKVPASSARQGSELS